MKRHYILTFILCAATVAAFAQLPMGSWRMHNAFTEATQIAQSDKLVYAVTDGSLFTVDKEDSEVNYKSKVTGLTGTHISQIAYSETIRRLLIVYNDGKIDLLDDDDEVESIYDLYLSQINYNKSPNSVAIKEGYAYLAMDFGVLVINLKKREIADTYSVLSADDEKKPFISFALTTDSLYAATRDAVYAADFKHNLVDYASWHKKQNIPDNGNITKIGTIADKLYLLQNGKVYEQSSAGWNIISDTLTVTGFSCEADNIYCFTPDLTYRITADSAPVALDVPNPAAAIVFDKFAQTYWLALYGYGVGKYDDRSKTISYVFPSGPCNKNPYRIRCMEDATYIVPGGYFVSGDGKIGELMIYQNGDWNNYGVGFFAKQLDGMVPHDFCDVAVEPNHPEHFFIASYGNGLFEFRDNQLYKWYLPDNSILTSVIPSNPKSYTWVDGLTFDADGNLYMLNVSDAGVKILDRNCNWHAISNEATKDRNRTKDLLISSLNKNIKIILI